MTSLGWRRNLDEAAEWKRVTTALMSLCALPALLLSPQIVLDTQYWTVLSFLVITASLLLFCLFSFLTQSADAFRIAPAIFRFPGEVPWGSPWPFPSLASVPGAVSHLVDHLQFRCHLLFRALSTFLAEVPSALSTFPP